MRDIINNISNWIIKIFFIIFVLFFSLSSILTTNYLDFGNPGGYKIIYENGFNIPYIILLIILILFIVIANKNKFFKIKEEQLLILEIVIFLICGGVLIYLHKDASLECDSRSVMDSAIMLFKGDYTALDFKSYLNAYPNNFGLFTFDYLLLKLFKQESVVICIFRIINLVCSVSLYFFLYKITNLLFNDYFINMNLILMFLGFNQLLFSSMFVYGNVISYSLSVISVYFLLKYFKKDGIINVLITIISIIISIFIRRNSVIVAIAEIIYIILFAIKSKKALFLLCIPIIIGLLFAITIGVEKYYGSLVNYDYSKTAFPTETWIAYGLNYDRNTPGRWFDEYERIHDENNFETELVIVEANQYITNTLHEFVSNPRLGITFFINKFSSSWSDPRYDSFTRTHNTLNPLLEEDYFQDSLTCYWDAWLTIASIGLLLLLIIRYRFKLEYMLPALCVIGGFLFHSLWEVKALYCLQYIIFVLPYCALGLSKIIQFSKQ